MRILISNDDGIHARGLQVLEKIARQLSDDIWVVAPETEQSGASHSLSLADPLRLRQLDDRHFAIKGTPSDCVLMAVRTIMTEPPDLVLSGINRGQNAADDVTYSGTIAAAMEGAVLGLRSIALSQSYGIFTEDNLRWEVGELHGAETLRQIIDFDLPTGVLLNVNFPDCLPEEVAGIEITRQGKRDQSRFYVEARQDVRNDTYYWLGFERERSNPATGTDLRALYERRISITPLHMDLTETAVLKKLQQSFHIKA